MTAAGTGEAPVGLASTFLGAAVPVVLFSARVCWASVSLLQSAGTLSSSGNPCSFGPTPQVSS